MGTMSASNAAPLPRLGEVFFDVRSAARSLRISWYADTGVAVLSIWQGETCTGSFRLPMAELPRMIEALQRGPDGLAGPGGEDQAPSGQSAHAGQPQHADSSVYPGEPGLAHYPGQPGESPYPGEPGQAYDRRQPGGPGGPHQLVRPPAPTGPGRQNSASESAGRPSGSAIRGYSPPLPGIEYQAAEAPPPAGPRRPRRADEQPEDHWDTGSSSPAGDGLEPLPESFPYGLRLPDHELR